MGLSLTDIRQRAVRSDNLLRLGYGLIALVVVITVVSWSDTMVGSFPTLKSDDVLWQQVDAIDGPHLYIAAVSPEGVGAHAGIMPGDRVISINSVTIEDAPDLLMFAQGVLNDAPTDRPIPYIIERQGERIELAVQLTRIYIEGILIYPIFALFWLVIGLIAVLARPRGRVQTLFFATGAMIFFTITSPVATSIPVFIVWSFCGIAFLFFWILFADTFPVRQRLFESRKRQLFVILPLIGITALFLVVIFTGPTGVALLASTEFQVLRWGSTVVYGLSYTLGIVLLLRGYTRIEPGVNRRPMQIVVAGTIISALTLVYVSARAQSGDAFDILRPEIFIPTIPVLALPLSFGYAIFRYQLMDVRSVFRTTLVYLVTTGAILGLYLAIALNLGDLLELLFDFEPSRGVEFVLLLCFLLLFEPVRRSVAKLVADNFFPEYSDFSGSFDAFGDKVSGTIGAEAVMTLVRKTMADDLAIRPVGTLLFDNEKPQLHVDPEHPVATNDDLVDRLARLSQSGSAILSLAAQQDRRLAPLIEADYHYAVPMQSGGRTTGLLLFGGRSDGRDIRGSQISFLRSIASQTASAIEAERLYEGELERRQVQAELDMARRIQESLLPSTPPKIDGASFAARSIPARTVGGDYYDVIRLDDDRFLLLIADVSGKGLPASLYMAELHGMARIVITPDRSPAAMLGLLDDRLTDVLEPGAFVTATIAIVDMQRRTLRMARAGHTPTLLVRNNVIERLAPQGLPLGIGRHDLFVETIEEIEFAVQTGDRLFFYSDGVTEAMNEELALYGEARLDRTLVDCHDSDPQECLSTLFTDLASHRHEAEQNDDITMLLLDVVEKGQTEKRR